MYLKLVFYYFVLYYMKIFNRLFFGRIEVVGLENIPVGKPIIYSCNHQNAFMDALVLGAYSPMRITSMTRSDVFNTPLKWFMDALQMLPIYRMRDGIDQLAKNEAVFENIRNLLKRNKAILIFSEGNHGNDYFLRPLTKGSSRMALESLEKMPDKDIQIVPTGLNYFHHQRPGNKITVVYGKPIPVKEYFHAYQEHPVRGANQLKEAVSEGMKECLIIPENSEDYMEKRDRINRYTEKYAFKDIRERIGSGDQKLPEKKPNPSLALFGKVLGVFNFLPLLILQIVLAPIKDIVFYGSLKYAFGMIVFPLWYLIVFGISSVILDPVTGLVITLSLLLMLVIRLKVLKWSNPPH